MKEKQSNLFRWALLLVKHRHNRKPKNRESSAKVDVYDYAAQFDCLPTFEYIEIPRPQHQPGPSHSYWCRITVQGTSVIGEGHSTTGRVPAELFACMNFKAEAEKFHLGGQMLVKHINKLTSATGEKFLQYCKIQQKDWEPYNFLTRLVGSTTHIGSLYQGTRLLSECTMYSYVTRLCFSKR
jgi:hypothetical protein